MGRWSCHSLASEAVRHGGIWHQPGCCGGRKTEQQSCLSSSRRKLHKPGPSEGKQSPDWLLGALGTHVPHGSQGERRTARLRELSMRRAVSDAQFTVPAELCSMKVKEDDPARSEGNSTSPNPDGYTKASIPQELLHQKETFSLSLYHLHKGQMAVCDAC